MYALAFDMVVGDLKKQHPTGNPTTGYNDIRGTLESRGFRWTQGSLYLLDKEDMSILFAAIQDLIKLPWFPPSVRDIRAFRVEQWSDFTTMVKAAAGPGAAKPIPAQTQLPNVPNVAPTKP